MAGIAISATEKLFCHGVSSMVGWPRFRLPFSRLPRSVPALKVADCCAPHSLWPENILPPNNGLCLPRPATALGRPSRALRWRSLTRAPRLSSCTRSSLWLISASAS